MDRNVMAAISCGDISVFLTRRDSAPSTLVWNVDDADALLAQLEEHGVTPIDAIATRPWGMREFTIEDPWGNRMRIGHVDESQADYSEFSV